MRGNRRHYTGVDNTVIRHFGVRLAALLVGLLCALLLALVAVVYVRTEGAVFSSLHAELETRAQSEEYHLSDLPVHAVQGPPGDNDYDDQAHPIQESARETQERGDVLIAFVDRSLHFVGGTGGPFGSQVLDVAAASTALQRGTAVYSTRRDGANQEYLVYSLPVHARGTIVGVVQTAASEQSYQASLAALLQSLLLVCILGVVAAAGITGVVVQRALQPIRDAARRQRDFVADAAHELRAPLAILRTAAELGIEPGSEEDEQEAMEQILIQGNHLARLVDDLALLARADSGAVSVDRVPLDLCALASEMVSGMDLLAEEQGVHLSCNTPFSSSVQVLGDTGRLHQLLLILLDNALKHTPAGGTVTVRVSRQGHHARLQVQDTGSGIDQEHLPHLFERFYRADPARSREGSGLGLAIAHWIVTAHAGQIRAATAPGGGALFTVTLPLLG